MLAVSDLNIGLKTENGIVPIVRGVSFKVEPQEILGVVGESGSGKTMTLKSLIGLIEHPNAVIEGSIRFKEKELVGLDRRSFRGLRGKEIAMISQDPMTALTPVYTIGFQIREQIRAHTRLGDRAARVRALEILEAVGMPDPDRAYRCYPHQLSGGMRQRVCIAMAISCHPALLLADEPTTALDVTVQAQVLELLCKLRTDLGMAMIIVTHDVGVVSEVSDSVAVMYAGSIIEIGRTRRILDQPVHPYTKGLMAAVPKLEGARPRRLQAIPGDQQTAATSGLGCSFAPRCTKRFEACLLRPELSGPVVQRAACHLQPSGGV